tara:strand:- start:2135 stop:3175 length:1041 start_codon:yes stop_codon:yes gene_type:complete
MSDLHIKIIFSDYETDSFYQKIQQIKSHVGDIYIWEDAHPWLNHTNGITMLKNIRSSTNNKLYLVCRGNNGLPTDYLGFDVIDFTWQIIDFTRLHDLFSQKYLTHPGNSRNSFLFLTGKPLGYHRVGLLYKIWKHDLIAQCQYSFFGNTDEFRDSCSKYIDTKDQWTFFNEVKNQSPDRISVEHSGHQSLHYPGIPYDTCLYEQSQFSVISETYDWRGPPYHPTEKIWRSILNCHPFLLAGQPGMVDYLESLGFDCYLSHIKKNYLTDSNKWTHADNEQTIENIMHWLTMADKDWTAVKKIAIENQKIYFRHLQKTKNVLEKILNTTNDIKIKKHIHDMAWEDTSP